jgi:glycosyltransferase involved in cell wall biosynthesis
MTKLLTVIPVYNGERYLYETLDSVARQTRRPDRVIIHDNHSTDGTRQIYEAFKHLGFEWMQTDRHVSGMENFNQTFSLANQTEYFHQLSADDIILPDLFEKLVSALEDAQGRAMAYASYKVIDEHGNFVIEGGDHVCPFPVTSDGTPRPIPLNRFLQAQADIRTILLPAVLLKSCYQPSPVFFSNRFIQAFDCVFYAEWALYCEKIIEVPKVLCHYRRHSNTITSNNLQNPGKFIEDEWKAMSHISKMIPAAWPIRWIRKQRSHCLLAARSHAKLRMFNDHGPDYARQIRDGTRTFVTPLHWFLGGMAVKIRDLMVKRTKP